MKSLEHSNNSNDCQITTEVYNFEDFLVKYMCSTCTTWSAENFKPYPNWLFECFEWVWDLTQQCLALFPQILNKLPHFWKRSQNKMMLSRSGIAELTVGQTEVSDCNQGKFGEFWGIHGFLRMPQSGELITICHFGI